MKRSCRLAVLSLATALAACGGGSGSGGSTTTAVPAPSDPFANVDLTADEAFRAESIAGMGLAIYDRDGRKVFEKIYGDFSADRRVAVASASKLIAATAVLRLVEQNFLSLDSTTGSVLD